VRDSRSKIIETNDDACVSKLYILPSSLIICSSCVKKGYYQDDFVRFFAKEISIRPPLINRGYYSRVAAFKLVITKFLSIPGKKQIVSLGAGFDTTYFQLKVKLQICNQQNDNMRNKDRLLLMFSTPR